MQYDRYDPLTMTQIELQVRFSAIRVDLRHAERELQRTTEELTDLRNRPERESPRWKMYLGAGISILIALNSILINVGTALLGPQPSSAYVVLGFAGAVYALGIYVTTFIVGRRTHE